MSQSILAYGWLLLDNVTEPCVRLLVSHIHCKLEHAACTPQQSGSTLVFLALQTWMCALLCITCYMRLLNAVCQGFEAACRHPACPSTNTVSNPRGGDPGHLSRLLRHTMIVQGRLPFASNPNSCLACRLTQLPFHVAQTRCPRSKCMTYMRPMLTVAQQLLGRCTAIGMSCICLSSHLSISHQSLS